MHALTFHAPMFAEEQEAIGLFSEEEGETIHKIVTYGQSGNIRDLLMSMRRYHDEKFLIKNFCNLQKCLVSSLNYLGKVPLDLMITYFLCSPHFGIKEISKIILILNFPIIADYKNNAISDF